MNEIHPLPMKKMGIYIFYHKNPSLKNSRSMLGLEAVRVRDAQRHRIGWCAGSFIGTVTKMMVYPRVVQDGICVT